METIKAELISTLEEFRTELETLYEKEFLRLSDIEEDYKFDSHTLFLERVSTCVHPLIISEQSPEWLTRLKTYLSTKAAEPRTCFQLIDGSLKILA